MFNKVDFANILKKINNEYDSMTEFAKVASLDRSYISKYIHKKLNNPPTPKILSGIANASKGITTYQELMQICGYISKEENNNFNMYNQNKFIEILKKCQSDMSLNEFARLSNVDAGYLSRIINKKKDTPPSPKILEKISKVSKGTTTYEELMQICGYISKDTNNIMIGDLELSSDEKALLKKILNAICQ